MPDALELLKIRRSVKPREMSGPGPSPAELDTILTIGARVPDHGKLAPWRFIVFEGDARARAGEIIAKVFADKNPNATAADLDAGKQPSLLYPLTDQGIELATAMLHLGVRIFAIDMDYRVLHRAFMEVSRQMREADAVKSINRSI